MAKPPPSNEGYAPSSRPEATLWQKGTYQIVRLARAKFRDKINALAEVERLHPGAIIGELMPHAAYWVIKIRNKPKKE